MKRFMLFVTFICIFLPCLLFGNEVVTVEYFFSKDCPDCQKITKLYFPALQDEKGDKFKLVLLELGNLENFQKLLSYLDNAGDKSNEKMYAVVNQKTILGGAKAIEERLSAMIDTEYTSRAAETQTNTSHKTADRFTLATVLLLRLSMSTVVVGRLNSAFSRNALKNFSRSNFFRPTPHHFISDVIKRFGRTISTVLRNFASFPVIFTPNSPFNS